MPPRKPPRRHQKHTLQNNKRKTQHEYLQKKKNDELEALERMIKEQLPPHGINPFVSSHMKHKAERKPHASAGGGEEDEERVFSHLPISRKTLQAMQHANFVKMTDIQAMSLLHSLGGRDILGAAKTGSGKTLAFLIPVLELLYRSRWSKHDGLGALVLSPSRELALQIFEVLRTIGRRHTFSAGLLVGGMKNFREEALHIAGMNILVATPGRLLQHMDQTPGFNADNLQILVLDEADRLLEMGFSTEINAILENLPSQRQTLLFSATQTRSVKDLARLALSKGNTEYISTIGPEAVPQQLVQNYIQCDLHDKIDILFSFLKSHTQSKTIVFVSTTKQAQFLHETFKRLKVGLTLCMLYGSMSQKKRKEYYEAFLGKRSAVLFATDLASRGLDFPQVEFVFALDVPTSIESYIHRVGRTARLKASGKSITMVMPQEMDFLTILNEKRDITLKEMKVNPEKIVSIKTQFSAILSNDIKVKFLAMRYFESYLQHLTKNTSLLKIDVTSLDLDEFAERLGLLEKPNVKLNNKKKEDTETELGEKLLQASMAAKRESDSDYENSDDDSDIEDDSSDENDIDPDDLDDLDEMSDIEELERQIAKLEEEDSSDGDSEAKGEDNNVHDEDDLNENDSDGNSAHESGENVDSDEELLELLKDRKKKKAKSLVDRMAERQNSTVFSQKYKELTMGHDDGDDSEFFVMKRKDHDLEEDDDSTTLLRPRKIKLDNTQGKHVIFDDDGKKLSKFESVVKDIRQKKSKELKDMQTEYKEEIAKRLKAADSTDKRLQRDILRERKSKYSKEKQNERELEEMVNQKEKQIVEEVKHEKEEWEEQKKIRRELAKAARRAEKKEALGENESSSGKKRKRHETSEDDAEEDVQAEMQVKRKRETKQKHKKKQKKQEVEALQEDEDLALALLGGGGL